MPLTRIFALAACSLALLSACSAPAEGPSSSVSAPVSSSSLPSGAAGPEEARGLAAKPAPAYLPMLAAYLPASTPPDALDAYAESFALLGRVTVVTGLDWDETGRVEELEERLPALMDKLSELRTVYNFELYATVYPRRGLIRAGKAGESVSTPDKRGALIRSVLETAGRYGLDGIDLDWETPADEAEWAACSETVRALSASLSGTGRGLSVALYPENTDKLSATAVRSVTSLNLMAYDQFDENGFHATLPMMRDAVRGALSAGFSPEQILPGVPAYGRPLDAAAQWPLYNGQDLAPDQDLKDGVYYNSFALAREKAEWARESKLGGAFLYHLTGDFPADAPRSLLAGMASGLAEAEEGAG